MSRNQLFKEGVLFLTYSILISKKSGSGRSASTSRYHQLLRWCGDKQFDGVIILDECHNAKTKTVTRGKKSKLSLSKTAQAVRDIQTALPNARVVYSSATGGSDEKEMGYMQRLGLWGSGTSYSSFSDLASKLNRGGLSFLEMLCCDIKAKGAFLSRQLSFTGCLFSIQEAKMTDSMASMYYQSVQVWKEFLQGFKQAFQVRILTLIHIRWHHLMLSIHSQDTSQMRMIWMTLWMKMR